MKFKILYLFCLLIFASCNLINPDEPEPAFIYVDEFTFSTSPGEGTSNQKFTEVWAYANDQVIGIFDIPAQIPVLDKGNTNLSFFPGIKNNGLSSTRISYPFAQGYRVTRNLQPLKTDTIRPEFKYFEGLYINQKDWDINTPSLIPLSTNQGELLIEDNEANVFEGERCGYFHLPAGQSILTFKDDENLDLESGVVSFLEINYSCNNKFAVGLISREGTVDRRNLAVVINPTTEGSTNPVWNKIYIDLGVIVKDNATAAHFEVYFEAIPDTPGSEIDLYLDNIKLIHF
jgi:hypothetical protein